MKIIVALASIAIGAAAHAVQDDTTPAPPIQGVTATSGGLTSLNVTWTNVADVRDDGSPGGIYGVYVVAAVEGPIDDVNFWDILDRGDTRSWAVAGVEAGIPVGAPGTVQSSSVGPLTTGQTYWITVVTYDDSWNLSPTSVNVTAAPCDITPPLPVTLAATSISFRSADLAWSATSGDGSPGGDERVLAYDLRWSVNPIGSEAAFATAASVPGLPAPAMPRQDETFTVTGLQSGRLYYFAMKERDRDGLWSPLSNTLPISTPLDDEAPTRVFDLDVSSIEHDSIRISWTTPTDNDEIVTVEFRFSDSGDIVDEDFESATVALVAPEFWMDNREFATVRGLRQSCSYTLALRSCDGSGNWSAVSNHVSFRTADGGSSQDGAICSAAGARGTALLLLLLAGLGRRRE